MKNLILTTIVFLFSISLMAQTPVSLKLNLEKGKLYKLRSTSAQSIQQSANGQQYNSEINSSSSVNFKVISQEKDVMTIEFKFDTIITKINTPMYKKEMNSAIPVKGKDPVGRIMNKMSSYKLVAKISTSGKFNGFTNYKVFRDSVMMVMDSVSDAKRDQIQKQAEGIVKESHLQSMIEPLFAYLPEKSVGTGDKWETTFSLIADMVSVMSFNSFSLTGVSNNTAKVSGTSEIETIPSNDPNPQMSTEIKGSSTADLTIDLPTGLPLEHLSKGHLEGTMTIKNQGTDMKMPMVVDSQSVIRKVD
jgi:hypothetical protein